MPAGDFAQFVRLNPWCAVGMAWEHEDLILIEAVRPAGISTLRFASL